MFGAQVVARLGVEGLRKPPDSLIKRRALDAGNPPIRPGAVPE
jgi:hypothetical protein